MTDLEFSHAFHQHKDVLYRFAYRMTGSGPAAEDVVQDCFVVLWRRPEAYRAERGALRSFLLGIARNLMLKRVRSEWPYDPFEDESSVCQPVDMAGLERAEIIARAVQALPQLQREVIILAEYEDLTLQEIASSAGAELAAVKSRLHRARENLRRILAPLFEKEGTAYGTK
jgi:RNA polymerase sigma-70 factor (ECF subfamily)